MQVIVKELNAEKAGRRPIVMPLLASKFVEVPVVVTQYSANHISNSRRVTPKAFVESFIQALPVAHSISTFLRWIVLVIAHVGMANCRYTFAKLLQSVLPAKPSIYGIFHTYGVWVASTIYKLEISHGFMTHWG